MCADNTASVNPLDIFLRPAQAKDEAFLKAVHDAGRAWEFEALLADGRDELYHKVLKQQFDSQHEDYFNRFTLAKYAVIELCQQPIGRMYADFRDYEIRLMDLIILPAFRGKGIAEIIVRSVCSQASANRIPVTLSVHPFNKARAFYTRLGFRECPTGEGPFIQMEWRDLSTTPATL